MADPTVCDGILSSTNTKAAHGHINHSPTASQVANHEKYDLSSKLATALNTNNAISTSSPTVCLTPTITPSTTQTMSLLTSLTATQHNDMVVTPVSDSAVTGGVSTTTPSEQLENNTEMLSPLNSNAPVVETSSATANDMIMPKQSPTGIQPQDTPLRTNPAVVTLTGTSIVPPLSSQSTSTSTPPIPNDKPAGDDHAHDDHVATSTGSTDSTFTSSTNPQPTIHLVAATQAVTLTPTIPGSNNPTPTITPPPSNSTRTPPTSTFSPPIPATHHTLLHTTVSPTPQMAIDNMSTASDNPTGSSLHILSNPKLESKTTTQTPPTTTTRTINSHNTVWTGDEKFNLRHTPAAEPTTINSQTTNTGNQHQRSTRPSTTNQLPTSSFPSSSSSSSGVPNDVLQDTHIVASNSISSDVHTTTTPLTVSQQTPPPTPTAASQFRVGSPTTPAVDGITMQITPHTHRSSSEMPPESVINNNYNNTIHNANNAGGRSSPHVFNTYDTSNASVNCNRNDNTTTNNNTTTSTNNNNNDDDTTYNTTTNNNNNNNGHLSGQPVAAMVRDTMHDIDSTNLTAQAQVRNLIMVNSGAPINENETGATTASMTPQQNAALEKLFNSTISSNTFAPNNTVMQSSTASGNLYATQSGNTPSESATLNNNNNNINYNYDSHNNSNDDNNNNNINNNYNNNMNNNYNNSNNNLVSTNLTQLGNSPLVISTSPTTSTSTSTSTSTPLTPSTTSVNSTPHGPNPYTTTPNTTTPNTSTLTTTLMTTATIPSSSSAPPSIAPPLHTAVATPSTSKGTSPLVPSTSTATPSATPTPTATSTSTSTSIVTPKTATAKRPKQDLYRWREARKRLKTSHEKDHMLMSTSPHAKSCDTVGETMDSLLNFHTYNKGFPGEEDDPKAEEDMQNCAKHLIYRVNRAIGKHRDIIIQDTIRSEAREHSVQLQRLISADLREAVNVEKTRVLEKVSASMFPNFL